jgi:hypothetical protein
MCERYHGGSYLFEGFLLILDNILSSGAMGTSLLTKKLEYIQNCEMIESSNEHMAVINHKSNC